MQLSAEQVREYTDGSYLSGPFESGRKACGVTWDSREVTPGCLYIALEGERADGHDFVAAAIEAGAAGALVCHGLEQDVLDLAREREAFVVCTPTSTSKAIVELAKGWRGHLSGKVIGLSGSTGKTTTKNLVRDVLSARFDTVATKANQNNELGVPRTLLNAEADTEAVVVEMGMRGLGQIEALCDFVRPTFGILTNVGESHIEILGSRENIARAKAELIEALPENGVAFLNASDDYTGFVRELARCDERGVKVVLYDGSGERKEGVSVYATGVELDAQGRPSFVLNVPGASLECKLSLRGLHNVHNACAAAAVAFEMGMGVEEIVSALSDAEQESGRQEVLTSKSGWSVVNDAYNANPDSMKASLAMFSSLKATGKRIAVLGDMGELGDHAVDGHLRTGRNAAASNLDLLLCVGPLSRDIARGAVSAGMPESCVECVESGDDAFKRLDGALREGDVVLVKASHYMGLERLAERLI